MIQQKLRNAIANYDYKEAKNIISDHPVDEDDAKSIIFDAASDKRMSTDLLKLIIQTAPQKLVEVDELNCTPLHIALADFLPFENIKALVDGNPKSLWIRDKDGLLPVHVLYHDWESPVQVRSKTTLQKMKDHQELLRLMLRYYPESALAPCEEYGSLLEQISSRKVQDVRGFMNKGTQLDDREAVDKLDWGIRMMILEIAHKVYRDKNGLPPSLTFHPICAAIEVLLSEDKFSMLNRVVDQVTWCHSLEKIETMYPNSDAFKQYGPTKSILDERFQLQMMIFCNHQDLYLNLLNKFPLGTKRDQLKLAFRMGRYCMIEEVVRKYPNMVCVPNDDGALPVDLAESVLQKKSAYCRFEAMLNLLQIELRPTNIKKVVSPNQYTLSMIRRQMRSNKVPVYTLTDDDIDQISKCNKLKIGNKVLSVDLSCSTCLEPYKIGNKITWADDDNSACAHVFHRECIIRWLSSKEEARCPICRQFFLPSCKNVRKRTYEQDISSEQARARTRS